jgi:hypothetical protein
VIDSLGRQIGDLFSSAAAKWTGYSAMGSFFIYVLGYLALRFQLMALGAGTDLQLVDERYLFEGAKFLVYILATVPVTVLLALPLLLVAWLVTLLVPAARRWPMYCQTRPTWCLLAGIVLSVAVVQFVMRKCLLFDNLLLRDTLPKPAWFAALLTDSSDILSQLYFAGLLAAIALTAGLALGFRPSDEAPLVQRSSWGLLCVLVTVQVLMVPVNYGILMGARPMPRLALSDSGIPLQPNATAWLIWEGKEGSTFVVAEPEGRRKLTTLHRDRVQRVDIVAYDGLSAIRSNKPNPDRVIPDPPHPRLKWTDLAMIAGIGASPKMQKAPPGDLVRGDVFLMVPQTAALASRITSSGRFHSPIFLPGNEKLLALQDDHLVELSVAGNEPRTLATLPGIIRLVGVHPQTPNEVLTLIETKQGFQLALFDLEARRLTAILEAAPADDREQAFVWSARGESRDYGETRLFVEQSTNEVAAWWDVLVQRGDQPPQNLTRGNGVSSRQPAMSHDQRFIAFVSQKSQ